MDVGAQMLYVLSRMIPDPLTLSRSSSELVNVFYVDTQRIAARDSVYSQQSDPSIKTKRGGCSQNDLMSVHRANWIISSIILFFRVWRKLVNVDEADCSRREGDVHVHVLLRHYCHGSYLLLVK